MSEPEKPPFYKSCMFWIFVGCVWTLVDLIGMLIPAMNAARVQREQQAVEQAVQE